MKYHVINCVGDLIGCFHTLSEALNYAESLRAVTEGKVKYYVRFYN